MNFFLFLQDLFKGFNADNQRTGNGKLTAQRNFSCTKYAASISKLKSDLSEKITFLVAQMHTNLVVMFAVNSSVND